MINVALYRDGVNEATIEDSIDGLDIVGKTIGQMFEEPIILPLELTKPVGDVLDVGYVNAMQFDPDIDIHVVLTARELFRKGQKGKALGLGYELCGLALVDTTGSGDYVHTTTAHEVAHSMGFVALDATHAADIDNGGPKHCSDDGCLMYKSFGKQRHDTFCNCCRSEMTLLSDLNLMRMRHMRHRDRRVSSAHVISDRDALRSFYREIRDKGV